MQPPFQARTHALRMRPIHLMHRYLSLATEFSHAKSVAVNVRCSSRKQRRGSKRDNYSCRSVMYQSGAEYAAVNTACRGTREPVEMLLRCNGEREPSWSTDGHCCGSPAARRNSAHWWWNRQNRGWRRPDCPSWMRLRDCGTLRSSLSGIWRKCLEVKSSTAIL